jgi:hypothetical protein
VTTIVTSKDPHVDARTIIHDSLQTLRSQLAAATAATIQAAHVPGINLMTALPDTTCIAPPTMDQVFAATRALESRLYTSKYGLAA